VGLNLSLVLDNTISPSNSLTLMLPGFGGPSNVTGVVSPVRVQVSSTSSSTVKPFLASWDPIASRLTFTAESTVLAGQPLNMSIAEAEGFRLPQTGLDQNDTSLVLSAALTLALVQPVVIRRSPEVQGK
jgi:LPXTG-motif cell wall-anchored protein